MGVNPKATEKLIGQVDEAELAVRLIEAHGGITRPKGKSANALLNEMPSEISATALHQARTAILYMAECFKNAVRPQ